MMLRAGDVCWVDFGVPHGSEPGFVRPAIVMTATLVLEQQPRTVHVVPLTSNVTRAMPTEVMVEVEGLVQPSTAQCHLLTVIDVRRLTERAGGSVGAVTLAQLRAVLADLLDLA